MREGMYGLSFESTHGAGQGVLVFEGGKIYGADGARGKFDGSYTYDPVTELADVQVKVTIPPNVQSVFGVANPYEWAFDVSAKFAPGEEEGKIQLKLSLGPVISARYIFLRALPTAAA